MNDTKSIIILAIVTTVIAGIMLYLFVWYYSEPNVAYGPQRIWVERINKFQGYHPELNDFIKTSDLLPGSSVHFYYPDSQNTENRDVFQLFTLIRLPEYLGGANNDTSAFRAYSALDVTSHCVIKHWPDPQRNNRVEDPCQSAGYRVYDGVAVRPNANNLRIPSTGALPYLDLAIDEEGYLTVLTPSFEDKKNGVIGIGRTVPQNEIRENSQFLLEIHKTRLGVNAIIPFDLGDEFFFHYVNPLQTPEFFYYSQSTPSHLLRLAIHAENYCNSEYFEPPGHGYRVQSFGIGNNTVYYEIRDDEEPYRNYFDFCLDGLLYSIESNVQHDRVLQMVVDSFINAKPSGQYQLDEVLCLGGPGMELDENCVRIKEHSPDHLEEIDGYAIDYDGDVKHLPFADICTDAMKIILLTRSNIALPDEEFVMEDVVLPFGMNQEDFERCAHETSFTKSKWNMVSMENPEPYPSKCKSGPAPSDDHFFDEDTCDWKEIENEN